MIFGQSRKIKQEAANELLRLTLAIAIIAATIGIFALDVEKNTFAVVLRGFTLLPSLALGLYIIFTASHLKYSRIGEIGDLSIPDRLRKLCYDLGITLFWYMFLLLTFIFFAALFGWDGDSRKFLEFWPSLLISFVVLCILVLWSAVSAKNEQNPLRKDKSKHRRSWSKK